MNENSDSLLRVENLKIHYKIKRKKSLLTSYMYSKAVEDISLDIKEGETFGLVGESGCGKSTTGKAIVRLIEATEGRIYFRGKEIGTYSRPELAKHIQMIFQDPFSSLDPRMTCGRCIEEPLLVQGMKNAAERKKICIQLMNDVGLREDQYTRFPHEFSGGQRQRIGVARAIALHPDMVICDEPVSALDVSIQAQILNLMQDLQKKYNLTYIFISHNLSVVKHLCDRIAVMYLGHIVELADKNELFDNPLHPYTFALLDAIPVADPDVKSMRGELTGDVPSPLNPPSGCCFHTRCPYAEQKCSEEIPALKENCKGHFVACHFAGQNK
ncbi:MAG: ATP-binding cassette domain-containing protein [Oscillospiraceae bacterium]